MGTSPVLLSLPWFDMVKNDLANKRKNAKPTVKISNHAPTASFLGGLRVPQFNPKPNPGAAVSSRLQTKNLKCVPGGGFRVGSHASSSTVNQVRAESRPTVLDYLRRWSGIAFQNGWDQGYVDSFIEKQQPPPESDPETAGRPKGLGVSPIRCTVPTFPNS